MRMLFVTSNVVESFTLLSDDGKMSVVPVEMLEGYGIPVHVMENEKYAWAHAKLSELTPMEMTPLPAPTIEDILGGEI